jgi:hypothetical protein
MDFNINQSGYAGEMLVMTSSDVAQAITAANIKGTGSDSKNPAVSIIIQAETNPIRITIDGSTPTATRGLIIPKGGTWAIDNWQSIQNLLFISDTASSPATVTIQPYFNEAI